MVGFGFCIMRCFWGFEASNTSTLSILDSEGGLFFRVCTGSEDAVW